MTLRSFTRLAGAVMLLAAATGLLVTAARAQVSQLATASSRPVSKDEPVTFSADLVEYDRSRGLVTASGRVEAWQAGRVVRADKMVFDRDTGVVVATGNVAVLEPDGQVLFAQYAELNRDMSQALMKVVEARMAQNGRMAANGMRRSDGTVNELTKVIYSSCDLCKSDPRKPTLWDIRAASAVQDTEHQSIEFRDATLRMFGFPVAWFPFIVMPDPTVPRQSGLLPPLFGHSSTLGAFFGQPYYWVINKQADLTITPMMTSRAGGLIDNRLRYRFNEGNLYLNAAGGYASPTFQGSFASRGQFTIDDTWRLGFDVNRASSSEFVLHQHTLLGLAGDTNTLPSNAWLEGFGEGSYARLDAKGYQSLIGSISSSKLPLVLPRFMYSYMGEPDRLGGRLTVDTGMFDVVRTVGTNTRRMNLSLNWERPFQGPFGDLWKVTLHSDAAGYNASQFNQQPNYGSTGSITSAHAQIGLAVDFRWPFMHDAGAWGTQLLEPMLQLVVQPRTGDSQLAKIPNEDSLSFEFTDQNLFGFNRFSGVDRLEGGQRLNVALHGAWYIGGTAADGLIGQSYQVAQDNVFPAVSGLRDTVSDVVARLTISPTDWLDVTYRTRLDHKSLATRFAEAVAGIGNDKFRLTGGYLYTNFDPYYFYDTPPPPPSGSGFYTARNEITFGVTSNWEHLRFAVNARRDLATNTWVRYSASAAYEDECFILNLMFARRYTSLLNDHGSTALLFLFTFKTVGQVGYRAI